MVYPVNTPRSTAGRPSEFMHYVYILKSQTTGNYYTGETNNLQRRIYEHNNNKSFATRGRGPWEIIYIEKYKTPKEAKQREYKIKKKKRKSYIEWLISNQNGPVV